MYIYFAGTECDVQGHHDSCECLYLFLNVYLCTSIEKNLLLCAICRQTESWVWILLYTIYWRQLACLKHPDLYLLKHDDRVLFTFRDNIRSEYNHSNGNWKRQILSCILNPSRWLISTAYHNFISSTHTKNERLSFKLHSHLPHPDYASIVLWGQEDKFTAFLWR